MGKVVKKVKKAVKKVVRQVTKPVEKVAKGALGALAGGVPTPEAPQQANVPAPAAAVEVATPETVEHEDDAQTEAGRKKARAGGKKALSVARSSGGGLNI